MEVGKIYQGKVVTIKEFGCFVEVLPGKDGLCHISELADFRVGRTEDVVKMGDLLWVKVIGVDEKGRVKLSRKAAMQERGEAMARPEGAQDRPERGDRGPRGDRGDRGGRGEPREPREPRPQREYPAYEPRGGSQS
jgi:polyribonucleotide nucleotidyltransferase